MSAEWAEQPSVPDHDGVPGKILAAQRQAMGWTVEQVADQLKLAVRQVNALEAGDYAALPGPAVVRGFVRAYAKVVKLDAIPLVAMIPLDTPSAAETATMAVRQNKPASFSEVRFPSNGKRQSTLPIGLIAGAVVLIGAAVAAWQFGVIPTQLFSPLTATVDAAASAGPQASVTVLPQPAASAPVAPVSAPASELKPVISNSVPLISVPPASSTTPGAPGAAPAMTGVTPNPATAPLVTPPAAAPASNALVVTVREDSWVEVRPAKGKPLFSRLVKGGTVETVDVGPANGEPVTLIVGRPDAVTASLRGTAVDLPAAPGGKVARVQLK